MPQEGSLHITLLDARADTYIVLFAPYAIEEATRPYEKIRGLDGLREYLQGLNIHQDKIDSKLQELQQKGSCDICHVYLDG